MASVAACARVAAQFEVQAGEALAQRGRHAAGRRARPARLAPGARAWPRPAAARARRRRAAGCWAGRPRAGSFMRRIHCQRQPVHVVGDHHRPLEERRLERRRAAGDQRRRRRRPAPRASGRRAARSAAPARTRPASARSAGAARAPPAARSAGPAGRGASAAAAPSRRGAMYSISERRLPGSSATTTSSLGQAERARGSRRAAPRAGSRRPADGRHRSPRCRAPAYSAGSNGNRHSTWSTDAPDLVHPLAAPGPDRRADELHRPDARRRAAAPRGRG